MALIRLTDPKGENDRQPPAAARQGPRDQGRRATGDRVDDVDLQGPDRLRRAGVHARRAASSRSAPTTRRTSSTASARRAPSSRCRPRTWSRRSPARPGCRPKVTSTSVVHEFFQQSNETDWDFAWRLALMHDYEVVVDDTTLKFRPANKAAGAPVALQLAGHADLVPPAHERRPAGRRRSTSAPGTRRARRSSTAPRPARADDLPGRRRSARRSPTTSAAARPRSPIASRPTTARPTRSPSRRWTGWPTPSSRPTASRSATRRSRPAQGQGRRRRHAVRRHVHGHVARRTRYRGATGYQTTFQISGRSSRTLLELMRPPQERDWAAPARGRRGDQQQRPRPDGPRAREVSRACRDTRGVRVGARSRRRAPATRAAC